MSLTAYIICLDRVLSGWKNERTNSGKKWRKLWQLQVSVACMRGYTWSIHWRVCAWITCLSKRSMMHYSKLWLPMSGIVILGPLLFGFVYFGNIDTWFHQVINYSTIYNPTTNDWNQPKKLCTVYFAYTSYIYTHPTLLRKSAISVC